METILPKWLVWSLGLLLIVYVGLLAVDKSYTVKQAIENKNPKNTISVTGQGKVSATPDLATVNLGVITNGDTASAVQNESSKKINSIIDFVKQQGIAKEDVTTSGFSIYPQQDYQQGKSIITGFQANQNVTIKVRGVDKSTDKLSKILGGVTAVGANQVNGVSFSFDDPDQLKGEARKQGIEKAKQKALELAAAAGLRLGKVINVSETSDMPGPIPYDAAGLGGAGMAADKAAAPNVEPGNQDIVTEMTVVFEVR